jgi:hypothetical protein
VSDLIMVEHAEPKREILRAVPVEGTNLLLFIFLVRGYLFHNFGKLERRFRKADIRLPNTSTRSGGA